MCPYYTGALLTLVTCAQEPVATQVAFAPVAANASFKLTTTLALATSTPSSWPTIDTTHNHTNTQTHKRTNERTNERI